MGHVEPPAVETDPRGEYAGAQPFSDKYGEGRGGFPDTISEGGNKPPWLTPGNTRGLVQVNGTTPPEAEVEAEVRRLRPRKAVGNIHLCADNFKQWLRED